MRYYKDSLYLIHARLHIKRQDNHYYPFGLNHTDPRRNVGGIGVNLYQYNGKELVEDNGLGWNHYGARAYDPAVGRWWVVDQMVEKYQSHTPFNYVVGNPMLFIDPDGRSVTGDIYNLNGVHIGNDGKNDNRVFVAETTDNTQLDTEQARQVTAAAEVELYGNNVFGITELGMSHDAFQLMAATVYGESSTLNNSNEMYGIASAICNLSVASRKSILSTIKTFVYAATDGNQRFNDFSTSSIVQRNNNQGMRTATAATVNALTGGVDLSNGATGWDGTDLPKNSHRYGMNITNPAHDIHGIGDSPHPNGKYTRMSTAAHGQTMFYKIHPDHGGKY